LAAESILGDPAQGAALALIGPRRCGKTSLLNMLPLKLPDALVVFFDTQNNPIVVRYADLLGDRAACRRAW
jgi:predicted AAA+ superfamily ATPase